MSSESTPLNKVSSSSADDGDDVYDDAVPDMTYARRTARYLSKFAWYNPAKKDSATTVDNPPSLDKAWAYFEHFTLGRHFGVSHDSSMSHDARRMAEAGEQEEKTFLYDVFDTPESDLADFGVGVGMYFYTLRAVAVVMFIAGLINIPNLLYFSTYLYNADDDGIDRIALKASAICSNQQWEACPTCQKDDWDKFPPSYERFAMDDDGRTFILTNICHVDRFLGIIAYASLVFVCISIYIVQKISHRKERMFDLASQTTTDYTVAVENPPTDARDADEWREYFQQWGHVTSLTVALDNEEFLKKLMERRQLILKLWNLQPANGNVDPTNIQPAVDSAMPLQWYQKLMFEPNAITIRDKIYALDDEIKSKYTSNDYDTSNVFVIFETEQSQQNCLEALSAATPLKRFCNCKGSIPTEHLFREKHLLKVMEPSEPSTIRWQDLDETLCVQLTQRIITFFLTIALIIAGCILVVYVRNNYGIAYAALTITGLNSAAPTFCRYLTKIESHGSEGSWQASLYTKITACYWILSAVITGYVTPFVKTLDADIDALIPSMYAIFITEMLKSPVIQLSDFVGHFYRHYLGPRAIDQRRMNACFVGTQYELSERYTDLTNVLFMTFYYGLIFPAGFFFGAITLTVHYWVDKFCLLRNWTRWTPAIGSTIANMSRLYFFSAALAAYAVMSSYNFASYPYDNACEVENSTLPSEYMGNFTATTGDGEVVDIEIWDDSIEFKYCNQDMLRYDPPAFPAVPKNQPEGSEWMEATDFAWVYGWSAVFVLGFVAAIFIRTILTKFYQMIWGRHKAVVVDSVTMPFSKVKDIKGYVPETRLPGYLYPTILCDVSQISHELIGWDNPNDPTKNSHNVLYDMPEDVLRKSNKALFSTVHHWPPPSSTKK